jgi:hypothetical protein
MFAQPKYCHVGDFIVFREIQSMGANEPESGSYHELKAQLNGNPRNEVSKGLTPEVNGGLRT